MKTSYMVAGIVAVVLVAGGVVWYSNSNSGPGSPSGYQQTPLPDTQTQSTAPLQQVQTSPAQTTNSSGAPAQQQPAQTNSSSGAPVQTAPAPQASTPAPQSFTVNGNDTSADLTAITVPKGTPVTVTFGADASGTYHGGLDFRSSVVSTGPIAPGSTKTVTFTANQTFAFTPYWPSTNIAKPYKINVVVE